MINCSSMQSIGQNSKQVGLEISKKVKQLLGKMTLDEKIAELTQDAPANDLYEADKASICCLYHYGN